MKLALSSLILLCIVVLGDCNPLPPQCFDACMRNGSGKYMYTCEQAGAYCTLCRSDYCPDYWFSPFLQVGWNPFAPKTCDKFRSDIKSKCQNDNQVGSTCTLRCANGYAPSPELYQGFGGSDAKYTHNELMSFNTKCSHNGATVEWNPNHFSCITKEELKERFFPEPDFMISLVPNPYPEDFVLGLFSGDMKRSLEEDDDETGSASLRRNLAIYRFCGKACARRNNRYRFGCKTVGVQFCIVCRIYGLCASSRAMLG